MFVREKTLPRTSDWLLNLLLALLAIAITCVFVTSAAGEEPPASPPAGKIPAVASPEQMSSMAWVDETAWNDDYETTLTLMRIMDLHQANRHDEAAALWARVNLPHPTMAWKEVALGVAALHGSHWQNAAAHLNEAARLDTQNPLPHYYVARLRLRWAASLDDRFDNAGPQVDNMVAAHPDNQGPAVDPVELRDEAIRDMLQALDLAPVRGGDESLLTARWVLPAAHSLEMPLTVPTVGELMAALGAEHWQADAHWRLGNLLLAKNSLAEAEHHWDEAADLGMSLRLEYRELARRYRAAGQGLDAVRAKLKSVRFGGPYLGDL